MPPLLFDVFVYLEHMNKHARGCDNDTVSMPFVLFFYIWLSPSSFLSSFLLSRCCCCCFSLFICAISFQVWVSPPISNNLCLILYIVFISFFELCRTMDRSPMLTATKVALGHHQLARPSQDMCLYSNNNNTTTTTATSAAIASPPNSSNRNGSGRFQPQD